MPVASEMLAVASRGGLGADSLFSYEWDINDRLVAVTPTGPAAASRPRVEFAYDYQGRRVSKKVYTWNAGTTSWDLSADTRFVYDGWNLLAEFGVPASAGPVLARSYLWGLDLEGLKTGTPGQEARSTGSGPSAGGIGGLVAVTEWSVGGALRAANYYAVADGNGNVALLVDADSNTGAVETSEHEPFGRVVARHRADAGALPAGAQSLCPFGFSSKYLDPETGLQYFGHRYFSPDLGRWLCRDPLGEKGGANLYAYCANDPVNAVDALGLVLCTTADITQGLRAYGIDLPDKPPTDASGKNFTYKCSLSGWAGRSEAEIVKAMVGSDRTFYIAGNTDAEVVRNLQAHVAARMRFTELCAQKSFAFGNQTFPVRDNRGELLDPVCLFYDTNTPDNAMRCRLGTAITFAASVGEWTCAVHGERDRTRGGDWKRDDWIPGDWVWIENLKFHNREGDQHPWAAGNEGENLVYTGSGLFWGHVPPAPDEPPGPVYYSLRNWAYFVRGFESDDGTEYGIPMLDTWIRFPCIGLREEGGTRFRPVPVPR